MNKIGLHISSAQAMNSGWVQKFNNSTVHLVLAVGIGGELDRALQVCEMCPNSLVIYRAWHYGICESDHFEQYYSQYGSDPRPLLDRFDATFSILNNKNISFQFWNECGFGDMWPHFIDFNVRLIEEMNQRGKSASIFGAGPGYPTGSRSEIAQQWRQARPIFEAINGSDVQHYVNLHEYLGWPHTDWVPWLAGRYHYLLEDLADMGILTDKIRIFAGENGWADPAVLNPTYPPNPANGYRGFLMKGITPQQLAQDAVLASQTVYADSHFVGTCLFCVGDSGGWADFDLLLEPSILQGILDMSDNSVVISENKQFTVVTDVLNVRSGPGVAFPVVSKLNKDMVVNTVGYADTAEYRWRQLENGNFCAERSLTSVLVFLLANEAPSWKEIAVAHINSIREDIQVIARELEQLETVIEDAD